MPGVGWTRITILGQLECSPPLLKVQNPPVYQLRFRPVSPRFMLFNIGDWSLCAALAAVLWFGVTTVASTASTGGAQLWVAAASALLSFGGLVVYLPTMRGPYVLLRTLATSGRDDAELSTWLCGWPCTTYGHTSEAWVYLLQRGPS